MNFTHPDHQEMLFSLINDHVDFLLVGGYAVIFHGHVRTTGDMDVWLKPTNENKIKLLSVFAKLEFDPQGMKTISDMDFTEVVIFHIGDIPQRVDFLTKVQGLNFDDAFSRRQILKVKEHELPFLHLDDLIANKLLANRTKDLADIENLIKIQRRKS